MKYFYIEDNCCTYRLNSALLTFDNPLNLGGFNVVNINVVLAGRVYFQFYNDKPTPTEEDTLMVYIKNQYLEYYQTGTANIDQTQNNEYRANKPFTIVTGENTIKYRIRKNNNIVFEDTTFFVEPKDYYINFHF